MRHHLRFALFCSLLLAAANWAPEHLFDPLNRHTAAAAGSLLRELGLKPDIQDVTLILDGWRARIITDCSVLHMALLFVSCVLAYPAPFGRKVLGTLFALPLLHAVNIIRIAAVVAIGAAHPALFEYVHVYLGQVVMMVVVFIVCMVWLRWASCGTERVTFDFPVRLAGVSGLLFLPWLYLNRWYVAVSDYPISTLANFTGNPIDLPVERVVYYQTFNSVTFVALVLATRSINPRSKAVGLAAGLVVLWLGHVAFRLCNVFMSAFHVEVAFRISIAIFLVSSYLFPFFLWLAIVQFCSTTFINLSHGCKKRVIASWR